MLSRVKTYVSVTGEFRKVSGFSFGFGNRNSTNYQQEHAGNNQDFAILNWGTG